MPAKSNEDAVIISDLCDCCGKSVALKVRESLLPGWIRGGRLCQICKRFIYKGAGLI